MIFDSAFVASSASETAFFAVWIGIGALSLVAGAVLVARANRAFRRRVDEVAVVNLTATDRSERGLASAA